MTCADGTTLLIRQNILGRNSSRGINYQLDAFPRQLRRQVGIRVFQGCPTRLNLRLNLSLNVWTLTPSIWELSWSWVGVRVESRVGHLWKHPFGRGSPKSPFRLVPFCQPQKVIGYSPDFYQFFCRPAVYMVFYYYEGIGRWFLVFILCLYPFNLSIYIYIYSNWWNTNREKGIAITCRCRHIL